jgi:hypothetical protein
MRIVNVVKTFSQRLGPVVTSALAERSTLWVALVIASGIKIVYDILMRAMFSDIAQRRSGLRNKSTDGASRVGRAYK